MYWLLDIRDSVTHDHCRDYGSTKSQGNFLTGQSTHRESSLEEPDKETFSDVDSGLPIKRISEDGAMSYLYLGIAGQQSFYQVPRASLKTHIVVPAFSSLRRYQLMIACNFSGRPVPFQAPYQK